MGGLLAKENSWLRVREGRMRLDFRHRVEASRVLRTQEERRVGVPDARNLVRVSRLSGQSYSPPSEPHHGAVW